MRNTHSPSPQSTSRDNAQYLDAVLQAEAAELALEMERIKERRRQLALRSQQLAASGVDGALFTTPRGDVTGNHQRSSSAKVRSASACNYVDPNEFNIPAEEDRRRHLPKSGFREAKEAIKASWEHDSTLVGGYFLLKDNNRVSTFGRAKRFQNIVGQKEPFYYLSTDVQMMQRSAKLPGYGLSVASRGRQGCNVSTHWNDSKGGCAPGPGSYTPLFQKTSSSRR